jgi:hypothetical protein
MSPAARWAGVACGCALLTGAAAGAPHGLRRMDTFRVRHVEVTGTRLLAPQDALAASGITESASLFDDVAPWRAALLRHALVAEADIARRLPGTVVIHIIETEPLALARTPDLRPVDVRGRILPVTPASADLDLPVLGGTPDVHDGSLTDDTARRLLDGVSHIRAGQPSLWPWISEIHAEGPAAMRLILRWPPDAELLLGLPVESHRLDEVRLVLADLAVGRGDGAAGRESSELARLARIDARFEGQVIVSFTRADPGTIQRGPS